MKVDIYIATIQTELREVRLTKNIAKQFPIRYGSDRWDRYVRGEDVPRALCKIRGATIGTSGWLILVEDDVAGLAWDVPVMNDELVKSGFDDLTEIPTVIL